MTHTMDQEVRVRLTDDELIERGQTMATKLLSIGHLRKKRREDLRSINAQIEAELDEVQRLARVISEAEEARRQGDLFAPTKEQATEALASVAAAAGEAPAPSEPHEFVGGGDGGTCSICGSERFDDVHDAALRDTPEADAAEAETAMDAMEAEADAEQETGA